MRATFIHLTGTRRKQTEKFDDERITAGRAPDNDLCFGDDARRVSSHHAEIIRRGEQYLLRDLGSTNGTMVNGRRVMACEIHHDDLIEFGAGGPLVRFAVERDDAEATRGAAENIRRLAATSPVTADARARFLRRGNVLLILAIAAAMILGAVGGSLLSSKLRASDASLMSFAEVAERNSPAVVFIRVEFEVTNAPGQQSIQDARTGTGFVISPDGLIVTNRHLVRDWEYGNLPASVAGRTTKIEVIFPQHTRDEALPADLVQLSPNKDIDVAILKIQAEGAPAISAVEAESERVSPGDEVAVIGYPLGLDLLTTTNDARIEPSLSTGVVSRIGHDYIQLSLRAYRGNSGGPVLNRRGEVIGILTAQVGSAQDLTFCTPIRAALELAKTGLDYKARNNQ